MSGEKPTPAGSDKAKPSEDIDPKEVDLKEGTDEDGTPIDNPSG